jgi:hypothetical protein
MKGVLEESILTQHTNKQGHEVCWKEAKVLQTEPNTTYRKHKDPAHMSLAADLISQPSLDISSIWTPITEQKTVSYNYIQFIIWECSEHMLILWECFCLITVGTGYVL